MAHFYLDPILKTVSPQTNHLTDSLIVTQSLRKLFYNAINKLFIHTQLPSSHQCAKASWPSILHMISLFSSENMVKNAQRQVEFALFNRVYLPHNSPTGRRIFNESSGRPFSSPSPTETLPGRRNRLKSEAYISGNLPRQHNRPPFRRFTLPSKLTGDNIRNVRRQAVPTTDDFIRRFPGKRSPSVSSKCSKSSFFAIHASRLLLRSIRTVYPPRQSCKFRSRT